MLEMFFVFMPKLTILEVTEISQGCAVSLKGSDRSLYGNDRFPYKERGPTLNVKGCLKLFLTHWT